MIADKQGERPLGAIPSEEKKHDPNESEKRNQEAGEDGEGKGVEASEAAAGGGHVHLRQVGGGLQTAVSQLETGRKESREGSVFAGVTSRDVSFGPTCEISTINIRSSRTTPRGDRGYLTSEGFMRKMAVNADCWELNSLLCFRRL